MSLFNRILIGLFVICLFLVTLTGILLVEYRFFKQQATELIDLQDHYRNGLITLRRSLEECCPVERGEKKKDEVEPEQLFVSVNREPSYLKKAALTYARSRNPEQVTALSDWYNQHATGTKISSRPKRRSGIRKRRRRRFSQRPLLHRPAYAERRFLWPLDRSRFWISSPFGPRKNSNGSRGFHSGMDLAALRGTPVYAAGAGRVIEVGYNSGYGKTIVILHSKRYKTRYAHLSRILVQRGQGVTAGQHIGKVGATGNVRKSGKDPSHLHFEVYANGRQVNPLYFLV